MSVCFPRATNAAQWAGYSRNLRLFDHAFSLVAPLMISNRDVAGFGFGAGLSWNNAAFRKTAAFLLTGGVFGTTGMGERFAEDVVDDPGASLSLPLGVTSGPVLRRRSDAGIVDD